MSTVRGGIVFADVAERQRESKRLYAMRMRQSFPQRVLSINEESEMPTRIRCLVAEATQKNVKMSRVLMCRTLNIGYQQAIRYAKIAKLSAQHKQVEANLKIDALKYRRDVKMVQEHDGSICFTPTISDY